MYTVFVFYTLADDCSKVSWKYKKLPKSWWWGGSGSTRALGDTKKVMYTSEEEFFGPVNRVLRNEMKGILESKFRELKKKGVVLRFKTRFSYLP